MKYKTHIGCGLFIFFSVSHAALADKPPLILSIQGHPYPHQGINLESTPYLYGDKHLNHAGIYALALNDASPTDGVNASSANGSLAKPYGVNDCPSPKQCPAGVYVFSSQVDNAVIQRTLDNIYTSFAQDPTHPAIYSPESEWSTQRFALLFEPGTYDVNVKLNYYTQLLGLGQSPEQVNLTNLYVDNLCYADDVTSCITLGALNNFWRGVENVTFNPKTCRIAKDSANHFNHDKCIVWNVSQASPMRHVHVNGDLLLSAAGCFDTQGQCNGPAGSGGERPCQGAYQEGFFCGAGYASGGFIANTVVTGDVHAISQQQWFTRDSSFTTWYDTLWNMVFLNTSVTSAAIHPTPFSFHLSDTWADTPVSLIHDANVGAIDKPRLEHVNGVYRVSVGSASYPMDKLLIMGPGADVVSINQQLQSATFDGLIIEPGQYALSTPIIVPTGKFVLGLGLPELACTQGNACLVVSGKKSMVAGVMLAAGYSTTPVSETLLLVDKTIGNATSLNERTTLMDIFCRVGDANKTRQGNGPTANNCVHITANYTLGDNLWLWRADHDLASSLGAQGQTLKPPASLVAWSQDVTQHGLLVDGNHVTMLGLFSEHHGASNVLWNGENGTTYFYQSELNYEAPTNWACLDFPPTGTPAWGIKGGCPAYMLGQSVTQHRAIGLGIYTYFQNNLFIPAAVITPGNHPGIQIQHLVGRYLNSTAEKVNPAPTDSGLSALLRLYDGTAYGYSASKGDGSDLAKTPALGLASGG